jgi:hypothetical protein
LVFATGLACEAPQPRQRISPQQPPSSYEYRWALPQGDPADPTNMGVCVVRPNFGQDAESLVRDPLYKNFARGFAKSMAADLDRALVAKGLRVAGPYDTYDDITYPDKQSSDLALTPQVFIAINLRPDKDMLIGAPDAPASAGTVDLIRAPFRGEIQGQVVFELREPLSREKLWVKKLELEPMTISGFDEYEFVVMGVNEYGWATSWRRGEMLYNGHEAALVNAMQRWYPVIMTKAWTYLNTEEMKNMKPQVEEIRKMKRY